MEMKFHDAAAIGTIGSQDRGSQDSSENTPDSNGKTFEENISRLETLARQLERGDLSLEDALEFYKEGVTLIGYCQRSLARAAKEIEILTEGLSDERGSSG